MANQPNVTFGALGAGRAGRGLSDAMSGWLLSTPLMLVLAFFLILITCYPFFFTITIFINQPFHVRMSLTLTTT